MEPNTPKKRSYFIEEQQVFSRSLLWSIQEQYFAERGVEAWRQGEVPHYVTSHPRMANSYAEIVFAFLRDQDRLAAGDDKLSHQPLYLCELGAGSGRFAFHFLSRLAGLCQQGRVPLTSFCYVLTGLAESNLAFWRQHARFQRFFEEGLLDLALFDINQSQDIHLERCGETIGVGTLQRPLVVIANYLFDSIRQELFYIEQKRCYQCLVSLFTDEEPHLIEPAKLLTHLGYRYDYQALAEAPYQEPYLQALLATYQQTLSKSHLLLPVTGVRCLQRLRKLSQQGLLLLSADKGTYHLSALEGQPPPELVHHQGCFSLSVNYHAFKTFCEQRDGIALLPDSSNSLVIIFCLFVDQPNGYRETISAYQRHVQEFGPDDFYRITRHVRQYLPQMSAQEILAYLRLSFYDSHQFARYLPRLMELVPHLKPNECEVFSEAVDKVWDLYFPLGEELDLAYQIACLLYQMDNYPRALTYFERSIEIYGQHSGTLVNMAVCHQFLEQYEEAASLLRKVLEYDPDNQQAKALLASRLPPPSNVMTSQQANVQGTTSVRPAPAFQAAPFRTQTQWHESLLETYLQRRATASQIIQPKEQRAWGTANWGEAQAIYGGLS